MSVSLATTCWATGSSSATMRTAPADDAVVTVTPEDAANSSILKQSGAPAGKRRRVDDRLNVVPLGPLPAQRPLGPSAHEVWFGRPEN